MSTLEIKQRFLPHWRMSGAWYFLTFRLYKGVLSDGEIGLVRAHILEVTETSYSLAAVCVMPNHVHIILSPREGHSLSRIMQKIKGASARLINLRRGRSGRLWQVESWDRIIRDETEFQEKLNYMLMNPVKAGLIENPWEWCGWYVDLDGAKRTD